MPINLNPTTISVWANLIAVLINLGITTEAQIEALLKARVGPSDTDPDVQAQTAAMMIAVRQELAEIRAKAQAEANRTE
jgi:hypothetical protein